MRKIAFRTPDATFSRELRRVRTFAQCSKCGVKLAPRSMAYRDTILQDGVPPARFWLCGDCGGAPV